MSSSAAVHEQRSFSAGGKPELHGWSSCQVAMRGGSSSASCSWRSPPPAISRRISSLPATPTSSSRARCRGASRRSCSHLAFPHRVDRIVTVIEATTPEAAASAAHALVKELSPRSDVIRTISQLEGSEFFERNGILFRSLDEVRRADVQPGVSAQLPSSERWQWIRRCAASFARCRSRSKVCAWGKPSWTI